MLIFVNKNATKNPCVCYYYTICRSQCIHCFVIKCMLKQLLAKDKKQSTIETYESIMDGQLAEVIMFNWDTKLKILIRFAY